MERVSSSDTRLSRLLLIAGCGVIVLAGMHAASPVIGPVVIALLLTIAWSPVASWLRRRGWPPTVAALTGIVVASVVIALLGLLVWSSLGQLQAKLPDYQPRVDAIRQSVAERLRSLPFDASPILSAEPLQPGALVSHALGFIRGLTATVGYLAALVFIMAFMMIEAVRYPAKLHDAISSSGEARERLDRFGRSMRRYVVINSVFGLIVGALDVVLLLSLGVDFAILWGVVAFVLTFLPNVGFLIALSPPAALALIQFGFARAALVVAGFALINFVVDNVIKPRVVGESLDLSPAVIVLSFVFWTWMLGLSGALLAVPLSLAARFLFENFHETRWLAHVMSNAKPATRPRHGATHA